VKAMRVAFCPSSREALRPNIHLTHRRREIGWVVGDRQVAQCAGIKANPSERLGRRNNWRPARKRFDGLDGQSMAFDCWRQNACGLRVNVSDVVDPSL
jgi:ribosomal protein S5